MLNKLTLPEIEISDDTIVHCVANRFRLARKAAGLTQEATGELMGITFQQVQKYERGTNRVPVEKLARLAKATGRPVAWFFQDVLTGKPEESDADIVERLARDPVFAELAECWLRLRPSARDTAMQTTRLLANLTAQIEQGRAA